MRACSKIAERSLSYAKTVPASAMRACSKIAERSLSYAKTVPVSAMRACSQIAERRLSYAKVQEKKQSDELSALFIVSLYPQTARLSLPPDVTYC